MRLNPFKNIRLSTQLFALVAVSLAIAAGLMAYAAQQVQATQGTLKHTIDNRMVSGQAIQGVADALSLSLEASLDVIEKKQTAQEAHDLIKEAVDKAHDDWDRYFLGEMIEEEQALADETTPMLDAAYGAIDKLLKKLGNDEVADLAAWRNNTLRPALADGSRNLKKLIEMQLTAANMDLDRAKANYETAQRNGIMLLSGGALLAVVLALFIIRGAMRKLGADPREAAEVARRVASGDLQFEMEAGKHDEVSLMGALRQMKASLLHSKLDYEGQINAIAKVQGVIECTPAGDVINANEIFLKLLGYSLEDVRGKNYSMFVDAEVRGTASYQGFWPALARGESRQGEYRKVTREGRDVWVQGVYNPILDAEGKPSKVVAYLSDITKQREEAILNAAFRGALNQLDANVMVADNSLRIVFVNPAAAAMLARAQESFRRDLPAFDAGALQGASLESMTRDPAALRGEIERLTSLATREEVIGGRTMKAIMSPMKDENGRRLGTVLEWFDRTQEVATESELQGVIAAVTAGNLSDRISLDGKRDFFLTLSRGINELVDAIGGVVEEVQGLVAAANQGDLTRRIVTEGKAGLMVKIGGGINDLTSNLSSLVSQVKAASMAVSRGADEISQGNANLSQRTEEQASSLEETASSMEEMTSTVKQNADNAAQANQLAVAARDQAEKGGAVVAKAVKSMAEINDASRKINDIIGVIDEIAFQTNLLALNAAVEAARAGEQGRGFAVVATEVRNLAGRSATAAKEIKALIQDSVRKVDEGSSLVTQSGATLEQIVTAVKKVTDIVAEIAAASREQSSGIEQVNKAVMQLDEMTQQNAALVEQASAASQSMADQARGLNESMQRYRVNEVQEDELAATPVAAAPAAAERRKAGRPWTQPAAPKAAAPKPATVPAAGNGDTVWNEF
ncbi:MAG TPA: methyl-accepting chemotaxis protein [Steroidobacteraceae bacterium]|jgi:methyl-accepting chemotaxis protein|nr:methyl-accepting chemotaxis protein [Steroidobacteraceae bacterium]